jgi:UDP-2,4-diacetamido-2,4,6-trideoxy-beta-L-altropyranose hydrolase
VQGLLTIREQSGGHTGLDRNSDLPQMTLTLRPASQADAQLLFDWRNDPMTRQNSMDTRPVAWSEHLRWLAASLARSDRRLLVAEIDRQRVGTVRLDYVAEHCTLSWTVAPAHRGRGVGQAMVAKAVAEAGVTVVLAAIKEGNMASARIAEACGFSRVGSSDDGIVLYRLG